MAEKRLDKPIGTQRRAVLETCVVKRNIYNYMVMQQYNVHAEIKCNIFIPDPVSLW